MVLSLGIARGLRQNEIAACTLNPKGKPIEESTFSKYLQDAGPKPHWLPKAISKALGLSITEQVRLAVIFCYGEDLFKYSAGNNGS